jgi:hypothetical protein
VPHPLQCECAAAAPPPQRRVLYVGADGIHVPLRHGNTREAKVGVLFWQSEHVRLSRKRKAIRHREYVATLEPVESFRDQLYRHYSHVVGQQPHQVVVLGDGAAWIWAMADLLFPQCIAILDFFHVSEYLWKVAQEAWPQAPDEQQRWVDTQQEALKRSQLAEVVAACQRLPPASTGLSDAVKRLVSYIEHNHTRMDYQRYLALGLMIGSGVVESSNRRIVTQRLKHSGMFWSQRGAQAVMNLRACYLSDSSRWHDFWHKCTTDD